MGKGYKKRLKQERAKVKLKVSTKTKLPKGQNITDTNAFKVKKIVIKDQVTANRDPNELLFRNKSNLKELISRLKHHNVSLKLEALEGLKDLQSKFTADVFELHFADILESVVKLLLDPSSDVRRSANKILATLLSQIPNDKLAPFFSSLNAYLMCCLTHIESGIRESGLRFLDSLLKFSPELCGRYAKDLLLVALDLISSGGSQGGGSRTLSVDLEGRQTSHAWRMNVLVRIRSLMNSMIGKTRCPTHFKLGEAYSGKGKSEQDTGREVKFGGPNSQFIPLYGSFPMDFEEYRKNVAADSAEEEVNFQDIGDSLIPLLLDMFIEVRPFEFSDDESRTNITEETAVLLQLIVDIILSTDELDPVGSRVATKHGRHIMSVLVESHFPYAVTSSGGKKSNRGQKTKFDHELTHLSEVGLNLSIVKLVLVVQAENSELIVPYLKTIFRDLNGLKPSELALLSTCLEKILQKGGIPDYFVNKIIENETSGSQIRTNFFHLLSSIALNPEFSHFHCNPKYVEWLSKLPQRLTAKNIPRALIETICRIAVRNFPSFTQSLNGLIEVILDNIPKIMKDDSGSSTDVGIQVASLLYWVNDWDDEMLDSLVTGVRENYWEPDIASLIRDIILTKFPGRDL